MRSSFRLARSTQGRDPGNRRISDVPTLAWCAALLLLGSDALAQQAEATFAWDANLEPHLGGYILPGIGAVRRALLNGAVVVLGAVLVMAATTVLATRHLTRQIERADKALYFSKDVQDLVFGPAGPPWIPTPTPTPTVGSVRLILTLVRKGATQ